MLALTVIQPWHWIAFVVGVLVYLALDLGVFHRHAHVVRFREAVFGSAVGMVLALAFAWWLDSARGREDAVEFVTGYVIELSLSMDNVFVIALIFAYFRVPQQYQHRVLFWGILGALGMRGLMIGVGAALVARFHWILWVMGAFLIYSGIKIVFAGDEGVHPEKNPVLNLVRKFYPVSKDYSGQKFSITENGRRVLTPLALVLVMVETTDLIFAIDSIPAIFAVTTKPFIVFTSNVFAILGLRSLYFLLAGAIRYFRYLKAGLSFVLVFVGAKMLLPFVQEHLGVLESFKITTGFSLLVVAGIIALSMLCSVLVTWRENQQGDPPGKQD